MRKRAPLAARGAAAAEPASYDAADTGFVDRLLAPRYRVDRLLGRGAVACTHLVREVDTGRTMVARVIHWDIARDDSARSHIRRLSRAGLPIEHPNVVRTFALSGDADPVPWAVCEFVEGSDLASRLRRSGPLPIGDAVRIARDMAAALEVAHERGLVHGSLRPADVLIESSTGRAKVYEFDSPLFGDLGFLGNPRYAAPEQLQDPGSGPRAASDVFALGVILYEMLAGKDPFPAESTMQQMVRKLEQPPLPLRRARPEAPEALEHVLGRLLEPDPRRRASAAEARALLDDAWPG